MPLIIRCSCQFNRKHQFLFVRNPSRHNAPQFEGHFFAQKRTNLHNFFERLFALPARMAAGSVKDPCVHKKTRFFCAQVTGEQPAFQGVNSIP
ncbi:hypothetical protein EAI43_25155 [Escherichia coli]|nr:hypothetical protein EAI43_25155 [Escherichia coli]